MRRFMTPSAKLAALIDVSVGWPQQKARVVATRDTTYNISVFLSSLSRQTSRRFNGATTASLITSGNFPMLAVDITRAYNP